tara:strand:+ start:552 stop:734 length:183 start_codon:yes stop_codon:yes gene_type:complete
VLKIVKKHPKYGKCYVFLKKKTSLDNLPFQQFREGKKAFLLSKIKEIQHISLKNRLCLED